MLTPDFYAIIREHRYLNNFFDGVFASDKVPKKLKPCHFIVLNTDPSGTVGQHWYAIYRHDKDVIECFDSLGIDEVKKKFLKENFGRHCVKELLFNTTRVQDLSTSTCGEFVLYFLFQRMHNQDLDYETLLNDIFCSNPVVNEQKVKKIFDSIILKQYSSNSDSE